MYSNDITEISSNGSNFFAAWLYQSLFDHVKVYLKRFFSPKPVYFFYLISKTYLKKNLNILHSAGAK